MGISITGRQFSSSEADFYEKAVATRAVLRDAGIDIQSRNAIASGFTPSGIAVYPTMYMMAPPGYEYVFTFFSPSFTVEGFGAELSEIPRPYNAPIVDIKGGKSRRVSFEFIVVRDNFLLSVEDKIKRLQLIADMGMPVGFDNLNAIMDENYWYIDNITFTYRRQNGSGATVTSVCNISLIEYKPLRQKFILLPKFRYGKFPTTSKPKVDTSAQGIKDRLAYEAAMKLEAIAKKRRNAIVKAGEKGLFSL